VLHHLWDLALTWQDLLRFAITWGACTGLVAFWYWIMSRIGTF
jgi:hypothetical protein